VLALVVGVYVLALQRGMGEGEAACWGSAPWCSATWADPDQPFLDPFDCPDAARTGTGPCRGWREETFLFLGLQCSCRSCGSLSLWSTAPVGVCPVGAPACSASSSPRGQAAHVRRNQPRLERSQQYADRRAFVGARLARPYAGKFTRDSENRHVTAQARTTKTPRSALLLPQRHKDTKKFLKNLVSLWL